MSTFGLIRLSEQYQERIWGGQKLQELFGKSIPSDKPIGEAWLVSDHPGQVSAVANGPHAGKTLHDLVKENPMALLGTRARPTPHGRFPLLLKLLDARDVLSVQVHPDDETARRLGEPDVGKTEMWYVLEHDPKAEFICGLFSNVTRERFLDAGKCADMEDLMIRFPVEQGTAVFVPAGTVHAIGGGIVLAEIQQNSDLTYRLYDWGRVGADGAPRELHVDKALEAIHFGSCHGGPNRPLTYAVDGAERTVLAACRYFSAERVDVAESYRCHTEGASFRILLGCSGSLAVRAGEEAEVVGPGKAILVAGDVTEYAVEGEGAYLEYYVPDLREDVVEPLRKAGYSTEQILPLAGDPTRNDLSTVLE